MFTKMLYQIKQNYTKNEHIIQQCSILGFCFQGTLIFEIYSDYKSMAESSFYSLVSNNCLICPNVALKNFH